MESHVTRGRPASGSTSPVRSRQPSPTTATGTRPTGIAPAGPAGLDAARLVQVQQRVIANFVALAPQAGLLLDLPGRVLSITGATAVDSIANAGQRRPGEVVTREDYKACEDQIWAGDRRLPQLAETAMLLMTALATLAVADEAGETDRGAPAGAGVVTREEIIFALKEVKASCTAYFRQLLAPYAGIHVLNSWSLNTLSAHADAGVVHDALAQVEMTFRQELGRLFMESEGRRSMERPSAPPDLDRLFQSFVLLALHDKDGLWPFLTMAIRNSPDYKTAMPLADVLSTFIGQTREFGRPETERLPHDEANSMLGRFDEIDIRIRGQLRPIGFPEDHIQSMRDICSKTVWALYKALERPETFDSRRVSIMEQMRQDLMAVMHTIEAEVETKAIRV